MNSTSLEKLSPDMQERVRFLLEKNFDDQTGFAFFISVNITWFLGGSLTFITNILT